MAVFSGPGVRASRCTTSPGASHGLRVAYVPYACHQAHHRGPSACAAAASPSAPLATTHLPTSRGAQSGAPPELPSPADAPSPGEAALGEAAAAPGAPPRVPVTFCVQYCAAAGAAVEVCGDAAALGGWRPGGGVRMRWQAGDTWVADIELPAGSRCEYKYVVVDASGRPTRWQEGPNLVLSLPPPGAAPRGVETVDSWCQRMQLRRRRGGGLGGDLTSGGGGPEFGSEYGAGVWELCGCEAGGGGGGGGGGEDGRTLARSMGVPDEAPAAHAARGARTHAAPAASAPGSAGALRAAEALGAAVEELRRLQAAALRGGGGGGGSGEPGAAGFGAAAAAASRAAAAFGPPGWSPRAVERLRGAFSPSASESSIDAVDTATLDDDDGGGAGDAAGLTSDSRAASASADSDGAAWGGEGEEGGGGGWDWEAGGGRGACLVLDLEGAAGGAVGPLVAALLGDDPGLCCAYVHDAICSGSASASADVSSADISGDVSAASSSGEWPGDAAAPPGGGPEALAALRARVLGSLGAAAGGGARG